MGRVLAVEASFGVRPAVGAEDQEGLRAAAVFGRDEALGGADWLSFGNTSWAMLADLVQRHGRGGAAAERDDQDGRRAAKRFHMPHQSVGGRSSSIGCQSRLAAHMAGTQAPTSHRQAALRWWQGPLARPKGSGMPAPSAAWRLRSVGVQRPQPGAPGPAPRRPCSSPAASRRSSSRRRTTRPRASTNLTLNHASSVSLSYGAAVPRPVPGGPPGDPLRAAPRRPLPVPAGGGARERGDRDGLPHRTASSRASRRSGW